MTAPQVEVVQLENGFRALLAPRRSLPVVASVLWYRTGSRDERTGETGLSHFLEHMMFKGTQRYAKGSIDMLTAKMGGNNNAFTDNDGTAYYFALASDRWETALEIEASRMRDCLLDPQEFASEKNVVLEELAMGDDDPWRPLYQAAEGLLYQVHPYHHPVIGYRQDLEQLGVDGMRAYYDRHYGPNRAFLVVAGDIDVERTATRIRELFGALPQSAEPRREVLAEPQQQGERRATLNTPHAVARLCIAFPTTRTGERDDYALDVLAHDLGIGKNSRLYKRLVVEDESVTDVSVINETRLDPGAMFVLAELRDGASLQKVEAAIREEIDALVRTGVAKADLARIRAQIRAGFLFQDESVLDHALKLARFEALTPGGYRTLETVLPTYASLKPEELKQVAARYLLSSRSVCVHAVPGRVEVAATQAKKKVKPAKAKRTTKPTKQAKVVKIAKLPKPSKLTKRIRSETLAKPVMKPKPPAKQKHADTQKGAKQKNTGAAKRRTSK
ncbi:MAG: pitrilysin family protein [Planctomycetota bacterium]